MISNSYETDAKKFISDLRKIKNAPRYAVGFEHTIKAIEYAVDVVSGRIERSRLIIQSLENSLNDILYKQSDEKYLWKFDPVKAEKTCFFIETLRHVKGKWGSQKAHIILEPWQCDIICNLFGWVDKESENRRYTESYCEVPRKNGKTVIAAGIGLYMFLADGESGAEVNCGAKTRTQAEEVFNPARLMLLQNPALLAKYQPDIKVESIKLADGGTFKTIVGVPIDGGSPHCAILDEIHQHNNGDLYESQQTGLGSREQPLIFMITTAGYDLLSFCKEKHDENVSNIMGSVPDERLFSRIYSIDPEDLDLIGNPDESAEVEERDLRILKKANPNFGVSLNTSYLRMQCLKSFKSNSDRAKFLTKHLNVWVNNAAAYFSMDALKYCADDKLNIENFIGCPCVISVDLNSKLDLGCICIVFAKNIEGLLHYYAFPEFFLPETTVNDCSQPNFKIYQKFAHTPAHNTCCGFVLNVSDGYETDYMNMTETISNLATVYHPSEIIFDSYNALQMEQEIERNYGLNVLEFSKTTAYFSPAMKEMSSAIMAQRFHFDGNECLSWNIGNVESKKDLNDNDFPRKANLRQQNKIDGAICCLMAIARLMIIGCEDHVMSIIETFTKIINRGKTKTENVRTSDYVIGDFPFATPDAISAESAMRISTVYSCIRVRAESIAMLPLRLYEISKDGSRKPAYKNPLYKLLHDMPNSWQTAAEFLEIMSWSLDTFGNFYAYISRYGDEVVELIPIANYMVSADYKPNTNEPEYTVTVKVKGDTKNIVCGQREILHIKLTALDGLHGLSPIQQVNSLFYNADSTDKLAGKVYQNGIMTSGVLSTDAKLDKDTHKAIRDAFYKTYTGSENAGKPMILDNGLKYQQFKISLVDTQFIDNRKYDRDEICGVFRIPPHMVANLDHATFSNIEQQNIQFVNYSLVPYLRRIEQRLNKQLIPSDKQHKLKFKFDLTSLLRGDSTSQVNYVKSLLDSGVITINDALEMLGMNTCIGGDIRKLPLNTAYMDQDGKIINPNMEQPEESAEKATENGDNI